jgi:uncharacterized protein YggE
MRALAFAVLLAPAMLAAQTSRDSVISINLTRVVKLAPDRATWFVTIEGTAETSQAAQTLAESKLATVTRALRELGSAVSLGTPVAFAVGPTPGMRGYPGSPTTGTVTARTALRVQVTRLAELARALAAASEAGAAGASGVSFESSVSDSVRRAEVGIALTMARAEAQIIATALDGRIGGLVDVSTTSNDRMYMQPTMLPMEGMSQPTHAPEVAITVTVSVRYRIVPQ